MRSRTLRRPRGGGSGAESTRRSGAPRRPGPAVGLASMANPRASRMQLAERGPGPGGAWLCSRCKLVGARRVVTGRRPGCDSQNYRTRVALCAAQDLRELLQLRPGVLALLADSVRLRS